MNAKGIIKASAHLLVISLILTGALLPLSYLTSGSALPQSRDSINYGQAISPGPFTAFAHRAVGQAELLAQVNVKSLSSKGLSQSGVVPFVSPNSNGPSRSKISPSSAVSGGTSTSTVLSYSGFNGVNQLTSSCNCIPPDGAVAAGPTSVVQMVNTEGELFSKQGVSLQNFTLSGFFHTGNDYISDPKIFFDAPSGRWFASIISSSNGFITGNVTVAISTSSDPTSIWDIYSVRPGSYFPDQPIIGVSDDKFVISANSYASNSGVIGAEVWVFSKAQMEAGLQSLSFASFGPDAAYFSVHPAQSLTSTSSLYMVSVSADSVTSNVNAAQVFTVTGIPPGTVNLQLDSLPIAVVTGHVLGVQLGTTAVVNTDDTRVQDAVWSQGKLWYTFNEVCVPSGDSTPRSCIRITQIDTLTLTVTQDFDFCPKGTYCYYPAIRVDSGGSLAVVYGFSNSTTYPSLAVTGRATNDQANTLRQPQTVVNGSAPDTSQFYTPSRIGRYGDFFGAAVDPSDQTLIWVEGEYHNNATGNCWSGNCWSTLVDSMRVVSPSFSIHTNPTILSIAVNGGQASANSNITLTSINGLAGLVSLSSATAPSGASSSLNPSTVNISSGGPANSTLQVSTTSSTTPGTYFVTINATGGGQTVLAQVFVLVTGFSFVDNPGTVSLPAGSNATSILTVTSVNNFQWNVVLSASVNPSGPTVALNQSQLFVTHSASKSARLTISTGQKTISGLYLVNVTGRSGTEAVTLILPVAVTPLSATVSNSTTFTGVIVATNGTVSIDSPSNALTISGSLSVTATNSTTHNTLFSQTYTISKTPVKPTYGVTGPYTAKVLLDVILSPYSLASKIWITFSGTTRPSVTLQVVRNPDIDQNGLVDHPDLNVISASRGCVQGQGCYNPKADLNADGIINLQDLLIANSFIQVPDTMPNFSISSNPASLTIPAASQGTAAIRVSSLNGFSGTISLTSSALPVGISATLNPASVSVTPSNQTVTSTLRVNAANPGFYMVTVTGSSGSLLAQSVVLTVNIVDFQLNANPSDLTSFTGGTSTIMLASLDGFAGSSTITFAVTRAYPPGANLAVTLTPSNPTMSAWGTGISTMMVTPSCSARTCNYAVTLNATVGPITHSFTVLVCAGACQQ